MWDLEGEGKPESAENCSKMCVNKNGKDRIV